MTKNRILYPVNIKEEEKRTTNLRETKVRGNYKTKVEGYIELLKKIIKDELSK